jgi:mRNA interferase MazF
VIVLGPSTAIESLSEIPVVPLSTQVRGLAWEVKLTEADGLPKDCVAKPEWVRAVDRTLLGARICTFPEPRWEELRVAILRALGF